MRILVTGGAGFLGSAYIRQVLDNYAGDEVITLDALTYCGSLANLSDVLDHPRHRFVHGDITDAETVQSLVADCDAVVNFAAETHVDRSLLDPSVFLRTNVQGVVVLLEAVSRLGKRMVQVSTDEVYGDIEPGHASVETDPLRPRSPYAAAKAGGDLMCQAYFTSFGTEVLVTRGCNTIGPRQYPEKLIPLFITNALRDEPLPVYGDGLQIRDWLHAEDHARGIDAVLRHGRPGEVYNVGTGHELPNIEVVRKLLAHLCKPESLITYVPDRPGHDRRYVLDSTKVRNELGWRPLRDFSTTLADTVDWYLANTDWWSSIRDQSPEFNAYYERQYGWRLAAATGGTA